MSDESRLFRTLEPPTGGLARLQRQITPKENPRSRWHGWAGPVAALGAAALVALALVPNLIARHSRDAAIRSALLDAVRPPPGGIVVRNGAALELPSGQADVRIYLVQSTPPETAVAH